jgi:hypothetical protein
MIIKSYQYDSSLKKCHKPRKVSVNPIHILYMTEDNTCKGFHLVQLIENKHLIVNTADFQVFIFN